MENDSVVAELDWPPGGPSIHSRWDIWAAVLNTAVGVLGCVGMVLNSAVVLLIVRMRQRKTSLTLIVWLAVYDFIVCAHYGIRTGILRNFDVSLQRSGEWLCKAVYYTLRLKGYAEVGCVCLLNVERLVAVQWPLHHHVHASPTIANRVSLAMLIFYALVSLPNAFFFTLRHQCSVFENLELFFWYQNVCTWLMMSVLPMVIVVFSNAVILLRLHRRRKKAAGNTAELDNSANFMLIGVSAMFVVCFGIYAVTEFYFLTLRNPEVEIQKYFWWGVMNLAQTANSTFNFFFYMLTNQRFRRELFILLRITKP